MDISKINPQHNIQATDSIEDELKINIEEDELSEELESKRNKQDNNKSTTKKKRRFVQSRSVTAFYENHDPATMLRKSSDKAEHKHLEQLKEKIKQGFNKELSTFITESKQPKAATLLQKNTTTPSSINDPLIHDSEDALLTNTIAKKEKIKETTKQTMILKQPD